MPGHVLEREQIVPGGLGEVFGFFRDPYNLERITPPWLRFHVVSATDADVREGTEIVYRLRWQGLPIGWRTRIVEYVEDRRFADEMLRGPYRRWHHMHRFEEVAGGVAMSDRVEYELPLGPAGRLVHAALVRAQLEAIFDYRHDAIAGIF